MRIHGLLTILTFRQRNPAMESENNAQQHPHGQILLRSFLASQTLPVMQTLEGTRFCVSKFSR